jgi:hypothetical protein
MSDRTKPYVVALVLALISVICALAWYAFISQIPTH